MKPDDEAIQLSPSANPGSALLKQKRKRIWLSDSEKYSILKWMDANNANQKQTFVHFGIGRSTMSDLVKERERLYQSAFNGSLDTRGRKTKKHAKISKRIDAMRLAAPTSTAFVRTSARTNNSNVILANPASFRHEVGFLSNPAELSRRNIYGGDYDAALLAQKGIVVTSPPSHGHELATSSAGSNSLYSYDAFEEEFSVEMKPDLSQLASASSVSNSASHQPDICQNSHNIVAAITVEVNQEIKLEESETLVTVVTQDKVSLEESINMIGRLQQSVEDNVSDIRTAVELSALLSAVKEKFEKVITLKKK